MEKKMNIADFAKVVGTSAKTIYQKISNYNELPVNERLTTVTEKVNGRKITVIVTNTEQIELYKSFYSKNIVNEREYYEPLTENNSYKQVNNSNEISQPSENIINTNDFIDKIMTVNEEFNNRYEAKVTEVMTLYKELSEVKSRQLLLEDKAGREGLYLKEINELKQVNNSTKKQLITVCIISFMLILAMALFLIYKLNNPVIIEKTNVIEKIVEVEKPITTVNKPVNKRK